MIVSRTTAITWAASASAASAFSNPLRRFRVARKHRLVLALMIRQKPNLLLLDEPTNHLDLEMRQALSVALIEYTGALVVISHDRHLLRSVCDELLIVHDGIVDRFKRSLDEYPAWLKERELEQSKAENTNDRRATEAAQQETATPGAGPTSQTSQADVRQGAQNRKAACFESRRNSKSSKNDLPTRQFIRTRIASRNSHSWSRIRRTKRPRSRRWNGAGSKRARSWKRPTRP